MSKLIMVLGATGQQGGATARALRRSGIGVRALVRDPAKPQARALAELGVELVTGDYRDRASLERAVAGANGVFSIQPSSPGQDVTDDEERSFGKMTADVAERAGVEHFVYTSMAGLRKGTGVAHFETKWDIEEHIRASKLRATIVRPCTFMELLREPWIGLADGTLRFFTRPEVPIPLIAADDIGRLVARVFADPEQHVGKVLELAGDEQTGTALAAKIGAAKGKNIPYAQFTPSGHPMLDTLLALFGGEKMTAPVDIAALRRREPGLQTFDHWLANGGAESLP